MPEKTLRKELELSDTNIALEYDGRAFRLRIEPQHSHSEEMKLTPQDAVKLLDAILFYPNEGKLQSRKYEKLDLGPLETDAEGFTTIRFKDANGIPCYIQQLEGSDHLTIGPVYGETNNQDGKLIAPGFTTRDVNELIYFLEEALEDILDT